MSIKKMNSYRSFWMGIAILMVIYFHSGFSSNIEILKTIRTFCYCGVDIFLFASGIGNYFSYFKDESPTHFFKRKIYRLMPAYVPFIIIWCAYQLIANQEDPRYLFGNLFGVQGFSSAGFYFNWYITAIIICYLLTPYLASYIKDNTLIKNALLVIILALISTAFWRDDTLIISFTRLPIFAIGMIFSKYSDYQLDKKYYISASLSALAGVIILALVYKYKHGYLWSFGFYWYPFILITPILCTCISLLAMSMEKSKLLNPIVTLIQKIGGLSFEIYLVHIFIFDIANIGLKDVNLSHPNLVWLAITTLAFLCALLLHSVAGWIKKLLK